MGKYRKKASLTEATQWIQEGDHPEVQTFRSIDALEALDPMSAAQNRFCETCGNYMHRHGVLDGPNGLEYVCPYDYIVEDREGLHYRLSRGEFEAQYEPYMRPPSYTKVPISDREERKQRPPRKAP